MKIAKYENFLLYSNILDGVILVKFFILVPII